MPLNESHFISAEVQERTVKMADGTEHVLHFRQLENTAFERFAMHSASADEDVAALASARLLVAGLVEPDGKPALTLDQAVKLKRPVMQRIVRALLEVNGYDSRSQAALGKV